IDCVGNQEYTVRRCAIVEEILSRPLADRETGVEPRNEAWVGEGLCDPQGKAAWDTQVRIPTDHHFHFRLPAGPNRLPSALVMPAVDQYSVVPTSANNLPDLRSVEPTKPAAARRIGHITQERVWVPRQQRYVPIEFHSKSS